MILVDTPVWIDHIRSPDPVLSDLLADGRVVLHPFVIGEVALGSMRNRREVIGMMQMLPRVVTSFATEILSFVERHALAGSGIGYVDAHLLAATCLSDGVSLWTRDRNLRTAATRLGVAAALPDTP